MTDDELKPYIGKMVAVHLVSGEVILGKLVAEEALVLGQPYAIENPGSERRRTRSSKAIAQNFRVGNQLRDMGADG
jgi:hypothetical protein